jgi:hypothetical protein
VISLCEGPSALHPVYSVNRAVRCGPNPFSKVVRLHLPFKPAVVDLFASPKKNRLHRLPPRLLRCTSLAAIYSLPGFTFSRVSLSR